MSISGHITIIAQQLFEWHDYNLENTENTNTLRLQIEIILMRYLADNNLVIISKEQML